MYIRVLKNRNVRYYMIGASFSNLGNVIAGFAFLFLASDSTESNVHTTGMVISQVFPYLLFGLIGGVIGDWVNKKKLMIMMDLLRGLTIISLVFLYHFDQISYWYLIVVSFLIHIKVSRTDYAHYLHTIRNGITDHEWCKIVYGAGLVETKDSKFVIGNMARHTAHPNRLQCVGGGLDQKDRRGPYFDIKESVLRELHEELKIGRQYIAHCAPVFLMKSRTYDDVVILYHIVLNIGAKELSNIYQSFTYQLKTLFVNSI